MYGMDLVAVNASVNSVAVIPMTNIFLNSFDGFPAKKRDGAPFLLRRFSGEVYVKRTGEK